MVITLHRVYYMIVFAANMLTNFSPFFMFLYCCYDITGDSIVLFACVCVCMLCSTHSFERETLSRNIFTSKTLIRKITGVWP